MKRQILNRRRFIWIIKGNILEAYMPFHRILRNLNRMLIIFDMYMLIQKSQYSLPGGLELRIVVNMEAKTPHRSDNEPDEAEEGNEFSKLERAVNDEHASGNEQDNSA
ncbi:hypothetical protein D3C78_1130560 [compost metagenome]